MRPAYEQLIKALEAQPDRCEDSEWREVIANLRETATPKEWIYLEQKLKEVSYTLCDIKLSKLLLGITDGLEEITSTYTHNLVHEITRGRAATRGKAIVGEFDEYGNLMSKPNPKQVELDL